MHSQVESTLSERARLWVPRETYLRERQRAERAEAIAVRLYRRQGAHLPRPARPAPVHSHAAPLLASCVLACGAMFAALLTLPFTVPPVV